MEITKDNLKIFFKSSEDMSDIPDNSVDLFISGSLFLGKYWDEYHDLFTKIYLTNASRVLKDDGYIVLQQTDAYNNNQVFLKSHHLIEMLLSFGYKLIDVKIWKRCKSNMFQFPFSYFFILTKSENKTGRFAIKNRDYHSGVWDYKQAKGSILNSWNDDLCEMFIDSFTKEGDCIIDPLAGSCRLLILGAKAGRMCYGYETNESLKDTILSIHKDVNPKDTLELLY